jgi:hypothetical protein
MTDELLKGIGRAVREQEAHGERMDAWANELSKAGGSKGHAAEDAELGAEPEAVRTAYAPLSAELKARIVGQIQASLAAPTSGVAPTSAAQPTARASAARPGVRGGKRAIWYAAPLLAAAAAVALVLRAPEQEALGLSRYELEVQGAVAAQRSAPASDVTAPLRISPGVPLTLTLRPERAVSGQVSARVYVQSAAGVTALSPPIESAPTGALRVQLGADVAWPSAGTLVIVVGRPEALRAATDTPGGEGYQRFERTFSSESSR